METKIKVIITGATGMVGEGVLFIALDDPRAEAILVINRKPCGVIHPKLKEIIHSDFFNLSSIENQLIGYHACFFCLGVSSIGLNEPEYYKLTYTLTLHVAQTLSKLNPALTFCYVSGSGTDGSEKGRSMWARVKGKTENDLRKLPFKTAYAFRPGYMHSMKGMKRTHKFYKYISWLYPLLKAPLSNYIGTLEELGQAMINTAIYGYERPVLEVKDIRIQAHHKDQQA